MKNFETGITAALLLFGLTHAVFAADGESILLDPKTGDYQVTYFGGDNGEVLQRITFVPATKIDPKVSSSFNSGYQDQIRYRYQLKSNSNSRQPIVMMCLDPVSEIASTIPLKKNYGKRLNSDDMRRQTQAGKDALLTPNNWRGSAAPSHYYGLRICWSFSEDKGGIGPGKTVNGFTFFSPDLPDIILAEVIGDAPVKSYPDEGPVNPEIAAELAKLELNDFVPVPVAVPTIAAPANGDVGNLLSAMHAQVQRWAQLNLITQDAASNIGSLLQKAVDAWNAGDIQQVKAILRLTRNRLKPIFADVDIENNPGAEESEADITTDKQRLSLKLATRVLAFNLKYAQEHLPEKR